MLHSRAECINSIALDKHKPSVQCFKMHELRAEQALPATSSVAERYAFSDHFSSYLFRCFHFKSVSLDLNLYGGTQFTVSTYGAGPGKQNTYNDPCSRHPNY